MPTSKETNKDRMERVIDALNAHDRQAFEWLHAEDVVLHGAGKTVRSVEAVADGEFAYVAAFRGFQLKLQALYAEGDTVAGRWIASGTHEGEFKGLAPTGKRFTISAIGLFRFAEGVVAEAWLESDRLGLLQQLGAIEAP